MEFFLFIYACAHELFHRVTSYLSFVDEKSIYKNESFLNKPTFQLNDNKEKEEAQKH